MGEIYLATVGIGPINVPGHAYSDLGKVDDLQTALRVLALGLFPGAVASSIRLAHSARNAIGIRVSIELNNNLHHFTLYEDRGDPVQTLFTRGHEETHVAQATGLLSLLEERGRAFGLSRELTNIYDTETVADIGGYIALFAQGIDPRTYVKPEERKVLDVLFKE